MNMICVKCMNVFINSIVERTRSAEVDASAPRSFIKHTREEQPPSTSMQSIEAVVAQGIPYMGVWPFSMLADYTWPARPTTGKSSI